MSSTFQHLDATPDSPAAVLADLREQRETARAAEVQIMVDAIAWAAMHSVDSMALAATLPGTEGAVAIAGEGAPLVAEFAVAELAAVLGRSTDSGRIWLGQVLECRYRLPKTWAALTAGRVQPWQARRIADKTLGLSPEAAGWVDRQVAPTAHKVGPAQLDRVIEEAIARCDPETAREQAARAAESRYFAVETRQVSYDGCVEVHGMLDLADAIDLDDAVNATAALMLRYGSTDSLDVGDRRPSVRSPATSSPSTSPLLTPRPWAPSWRCRGVRWCSTPTSPRGPVRRGPVDWIRSCGSRTPAASSPSSSSASGSPSWTPR